jgi:hypothetical protein
MLSAASIVRAAEPSVHATGSFTAAYNDNILAVPDQPPANVPEVGPPARDLLLQVAPGVALHYLSPRAQLAISYAHPFLFYVRHPGADNSADILQAQGKFGLSRFDELTVGLEAARYTTNSSTLGAADETDIVAQPGSDSTLISLALKEEYTREISESWSLLQSGDAGWSIPVDGGTSLFAASGSLGPQVGVQDHSFGLFANATYSRPLTDEPLDETGYQAREQVLVGGRGRWQWAFVPPEWALALNAGALASLEGAGTRVEPVGGAALRFQDRGYGVSLQYDRGFVPNLITGQTYFSDSAVLRGELPLSREEQVRVSTSSGIAFSRAIDRPREVDTGRVRTFIADAAIGWYPELYPHIEARYQYTRQWGAPPDQVVLPNFERNVISLSVSYMWPPLVTTLPKGHKRVPEENEDDPLAPIDGP